VQQPDVATAEHVRQKQVTVPELPSPDRARTRLGLRRRRFRPLLAFKYAVLILLLLVVAYPLVWVAISALRTAGALALHPFNLPRSLDWSNYYDVLIKDGFDRNILNSLWVCALSTVVVIAITAMAAYPLSRMQWRFRKVAIAYFGLGLIIPVYAALVPLYVMLAPLENSIGAQPTLAIVYLAVGIPISTVLLMGYMSKVPSEIEEAAVIDGCSLFGVLWRVILPVAGPGIGVAATFTFLQMWNELLFALVFLQSADQQTIPVALQQYVGQYSTDWPAELAAITLALVPTLIIYLLLQRRLMSGVLVVGGIT
jgi:raffinose/stachyose/melibiose transport system permease protein